MKNVVKGIVIKEISINDNDRIIHILTDKLGVVSAIAKNSKNIKNRLVTSTSLLTYSEFSLYKKKDIFLIDNADTIKCFHKLREDIKSLSLAMYFCQIADYSLSGYDDEDFLRLILNSLYIIEGKKIELYLIKFIYEMKFMCFCGYTPNFSGCSVCESSNEIDFYFDLRNGDLKCGNCKPEILDKYMVYLNKTQLKSIAHIITADFNTLFSFSVKNNTAKTLSDISERFLSIHIEKHFSTLDFFKTMAE